MIELERLIVERRQESVAKSHRLDGEGSVSPPLILHHDLGPETFYERVTDATIHRSDEIQPVR